MYTEVKKYEEKVFKNKSTYWLIFELLWRDFFCLMVEKHGSRYFKIEGIARAPFKPWKQDQAAFSSWIEGTTGVAFVDANMIELQRTGYMSNRGRQIVASYLVNDLGIDWLMGAAYFERMLIDYDPCSNYGNWAYIAGVGNDNRKDRYFNIQKQQQNYDPKSEYINLWLKKENIS
jgi:deoxyribodipyrimidine photo-lyase